MATHENAWAQPQSVGEFSIWISAVLVRKVEKVRRFSEAFEGRNRSLRQRFQRLEDSTMGRRCNDCIICGDIGRRRTILCVVENNGCHVFGIFRNSLQHIFFDAIQTQTHMSGVVGNAFDVDQINCGFASAISWCAHFIGGFFIVCSIVNLIIITANKFIIFFIRFFNEIDLISLH